MNSTIRAIIIAAVFASFTVIAAAGPANDSWEDAFLIPDRTMFGSGTLSGATVQACEPTQHVYPDEGTSPARKTVWYKWVVPDNGSYTFFAESDVGVDTVLSAYRFSLGLCNGEVAPMPNRIVENHNYNFDFGAAVSGSSISFRGVAGELIYISVDSYTGLDGTFDIGWQKTRFRYDVSLDFNNSGADIVVDRDYPGGKQLWMARYGNHSTFATTSTFQFGLATDRIFMADFDGDRVSDVVAVRPEGNALMWYITTRSGQMIKTVRWGLDSDRAVVGDYDGDGMADIAVTRSDFTNGTKTWHILRSVDGQYVGLQFGAPNDREMAGDYDGDGKTDVVVIRPQGGVLTWYILRSSSNEVDARVFGYEAGDFPMVVNFDNDRKTDIAVFRSFSLSSPEDNGYWYSMDSSSTTGQTRSQKFGQTNDAPQPADFDGDQKTDLVVYRDGVWWMRSSKTGAVTVYNFGNPSDSPRSDGGMYMAQHTYYCIFCF